MKAALAHGLLSVHLKIYPVIYLPSIYLYLSEEEPQAESGEEGWAQTIVRICKRLLFNWKGIVFGVVFTLFL